jgi:hypothetical protein
VSLGIADGSLAVYSSVDQQEQLCYGKQNHSAVVVDPWAQDRVSEMHWGILNKTSQAF